MINKYYIILFIILLLFPILPTACFIKLRMDCENTIHKTFIYEEYSIKSLQKKSIPESEAKGNINGSFFIGIGSINGKYESKSTVNTYYYVYEQRNEGLLYTKLPSEITYIVETNEIRPKIKYQYIKTRSCNNWCRYKDGKTLNSITLHVPTNTIRIKINPITEEE